MAHLDEIGISERKQEWKYHGKKNLILQQVKKERGKALSISACWKKSCLSFLTELQIWVHAEGYYLPWEKLGFFSFPFTRI